MASYEYYRLGPVTAYAIAKEHGFVGTEEEWLESLRASVTQVGQYLRDHPEVLQQMNPVRGTVATLNDLPESAALNDTYYVTGEKYRVTWTGTQWVQTSMSEADYESELAALGEAAEAAKKATESIAEPMGNLFDQTIFNEMQGISYDASLGYSGTAKQFVDGALALPGGLGFFGAGKEGAQYTISFAAKSQNALQDTYGLQVGFRYTDGTYDNSRCRIPDNTNGEYLSLALTSEAGKTVERLSLGYNHAGSTVWLKDVMICEGTQAGEYSPYVLSAKDAIIRDKIASLQQSVTGEMAGDAADAISWTEGAYISKSGEIVANEISKYSGLIPCPDSFNRIRLTMSATMPSVNTRVHAYDENGEWLHQIKLFTTGTNSPFTIDVLYAGCRYIRVSSRKETRVLSCVFSTDPLDEECKMARGEIMALRTGLGLDELYHTWEVGNISTTSGVDYKAGDSGYGPQFAKTKMYLSAPIDITFPDGFLLGFLVYDLDGTYNGYLFPDGTVAAGSVTLSVDTMFSAFPAGLLPPNKMFRVIVRTTDYSPMTLSRCARIAITPATVDAGKTDFSLNRWCSYTMAEVMLERGRSIGMDSLEHNTPKSDWYLFGWYANAKDIIKLGVACCGYPEISRIWGKKNHTIVTRDPAHLAVDVEHTMQIEAVEQHYKVLGGKTGGGTNRYSVLFASEVAGKTVVGVVAGATDRENRLQAVLQLLRIAETMINGGESTATVTTASIACCALLPSAVDCCDRFDNLEYLYAQNADSKFTIDSIYKMLAAMVAIDCCGSLEETLTIIKDDEISNSMEIPAGHVVSYKDALFGVILPSNNTLTLAMNRSIGWKLISEFGVTWHTETS